MLILAVSFLLSSGLSGEDDWLPGQWTGTWDENPGESGALKITIERKPDATLRGRIQAEMNGTELYTTEFKEVSQNGNKMTIKYHHPSVPIEVLIEGEWRTGSLSGTWAGRPAGESEYQTRGTRKAAKS
ncbi:MAG: hypothetical protein EHM23_26910 [Acidobacteria bacterium]|nr:MAG: hypothetical protein EHM23_26910 [Acidobacteriota bacterium]